MSPITDVTLAERARLGATTDEPLSVKLLRVDADGVQWLEVFDAAGLSIGTIAREEAR